MSAAALGTSVRCPPLDGPTVPSEPAILPPIA